MQFIKNGPDIPETLLQAHEDGRVVFFCGAGISYPAKLPGFGGLVGKLYDKLMPERTGVQAAALKAFQYDTAIGLLEAELKNREVVRRTMVSILSPDLGAEDATATHEALLHLSRTKGGSVRLITTNFDRLFEHVIERDRLSVDRFSAPLLPVPKNRWDGIVYVHGLLSSEPTAAELDKLVISSGDFGLAYLTERWAARFVSELFRNYVVCFVGYSLNDPVLRYMTDALAADRLRGEAMPDMFAFGSYSGSGKAKAENEWKAKHVVPILYSEAKAHASLHKTIRRWAETYRDGARGKERIVVDCAIAGPMASTKEDDYVGRMLWAVSDQRGLPAKHFAEFNPAPTLDWLKHFCEARYGHDDLPRFGVAPRKERDEKLKFSLTSRPSPYSLSPYMTLVQGNRILGHMDEVMRHLAQWLTRHLDNPALIHWLAAQGSGLSDHFSRMVEQALEATAKLQREENAEEISRYKAASPDGIPRSAMRTLWRLLLTDRIKHPGHNLDIYQWKEIFTRDGLTPSLRLKLRELLAPRVSITRALEVTGELAGARSDRRLQELVKLDVVLTTDHAHSSVDELREIPQWSAVLRAMFSDLHVLLRDTLDLMREVEDAADRSDPSTWDMPSITPHWQNRRYDDWTVLIELLRDAWLEILKMDGHRARLAIDAFRGEPYPTFARLALWAATHDGIAAEGEWVNWLTDDSGWWLWSVETQREVMRLLVLCGAKLPKNERNRLEVAILSGPPKEMFREDIDDDRWTAIVEETVGLRLGKLAEGGSELSRPAMKRLNHLRAVNPRWQPSENEREEFAHWSSGTGDPDFEWGSQKERAPYDQQPLEEWLMKEPTERTFNEDDWKDVCKDHFELASSSLLGLSEKQLWPVQRWREALQTWSSGDLLVRSWAYLAETVKRMPDEVLKGLRHAVGWWLEEIGKNLPGRESDFLGICQRCIDLMDDVPTVDDDPVFRAINHPVGHVTQALLSWWFSRKPSDNEALPPQLAPIFSAICDTSVPVRRHGRLLLAANVIALLRVDPDWTNKTLVPLFDWKRSATEARAAWLGYLWAPRVYRPLLIALKKQFLDTASRYGELGTHGGQYATLLTFMALDRGDVFTFSDLRKAIAGLPKDGLQHCIRALNQAFSSAGAQRLEYWENRVRPFIEDVWPKTTMAEPQPYAEQFGRLALSAGDSFPKALAVLRPWLVPVDYPYTIYKELAGSGICSSHPGEALELISLIMKPDVWPHRDLIECLEKIGEATPAIRRTEAYMRVEDYARRRG